MKSKHVLVNAYPLLGFEVKRIKYCFVVKITNYRLRSDTLFRVQVLHVINYWNKVIKLITFHRFILV